MKKNSWLLVILGVVVLGFALLFSAALGAGIAYFFLQVDPVQAAFAAPVDVAVNEGLLIAAVDPDSPAAEAGLVRGDIILDVNGVAVNNLLDLKTVLSETEPMEAIELNVLHGDDTRTINVELGDNSGLAYLGVNTCGIPMDGSMMFNNPSGDVLIKKFGLGAEVTEVIAGSPAEEAGLQVGDLIISVDGEKIGLKAGLADLIQSHEPGDTVRLDVQSAEADESHEVEVVLGENPDVNGQAYLGVAYQAGMSNFDFKSEGLPFGELPEGFGSEEGMPHIFETPQLPEGVESAVIISKVMEDTPAADAGLQPGDLILAVDGDSVSEVEAFVEIMQSHKPGDKVTLTIFRGTEELSIAVTLTEHPDNPENGYLGVLAGTMNMKLPEGFNQDLENQFPGVPGGDA